VVGFIVNLELGGIGSELLDYGYHLGHKIGGRRSRVVVETVIVQTHDEFDIWVHLAQALVDAGIGERHHLHSLDACAAYEFEVVLS
jgi:hypothetical protein